MKNKLIKKQLEKKIFQLMAMGNSDSKNKNTYITNKNY